MKQTAENNTSKAEIIIHIDQVGITKGVNDGFHPEQWKIINRLINDSIELVTENEENNGQQLHVHQAISVLGERGAAKTTFALRLHDDKNTQYATIGPIDPTMLETGELLFPHIFVQILNYDEEKIKTSISENINGNLHQAYMKCLQQMSVLYPHRLEQISTNIISDPDLLGYETMQHMVGAQQLRDSFKNFCTQSLRILNKKLFLIIIDDVDISFEQGWPVLESIRKYLNFPQIQPVVLGNYSLYKLLVTDQKYKKLQALWGIESYKKTVDKNVNDLVEQYLLKILPAENRVILSCKNPYEPEIQGVLKVKWKENGVEKENEFDELYKSFLKNIFLKTESDIDNKNNNLICAITNKYKNLPPSNIRMLCMFTKHIHKEIKHGKGSDKELIRNLSNTLLEDLTQLELTRDDIDHILTSPDRAMTMILPRLQEKIPQFWRLKGKTIDAKSRVALLMRLSISVAINNTECPIKRVGLILSLLLRMGWFGQAYDNYLDISGLSEEQFVNYMGLNQSISTEELIIRMVTIDAFSKHTSTNSAQGTPVSNRSKTHLYIRQGDNHLNTGATDLFLFEASSTGNAWYRIYSPHVALARIADYLINYNPKSSDNDFDYVPRLKVMSPTARTDQADEDSSQTNENSEANTNDAIKSTLDNILIKIKENIESLDTDKNSSHISPNIFEYSEIDESGYNLFYRFSYYSSKYTISNTNLKDIFINFTKRVTPLTKDEIFVDCKESNNKELTNIEILFKWFYCSTTEDTLFNELENVSRKKD